MASEKGASPTEVSLPLHDLDRVLLVYAAASDVGKHDIAASRLPTYLRILDRVGKVWNREDVTTDYNYFDLSTKWASFKDADPSADLKEGGYLATFYDLGDRNNHYHLIEKGVLRVQEIKKKAPDTYEFIKKQMTVLTKAEEYLPYFAFLMKI